MMPTDEKTLECIKHLQREMMTVCCDSKDFVPDCAGCKFRQLFDLLDWWTAIIVWSKKTDKHSRQRPDTEAQYISENT